MGVHYVVLNLTASGLFLIGLAMLYSVTGTLNMTDMALRVARLTGDAALLAQLFSLPHPPTVEQRRPGSAAAVRMVVPTREDAFARQSLADFPFASAA